MYKTEQMNRKQLEAIAEEFAEEDDATTTVANLITVYLNSKPGNWRLVSHTTVQFTHYFTWSTGE
jgi:hypothetical protein